MEQYNFGSDSDSEEEGAPTKPMSAPNRLDVNAHFMDIAKVLLLLSN